MNTFQATTTRAQVMLWRIAARSTEIVLRHRSRLIQTLPFLEMLVGGVGAYFLGKWIAEMVVAHWLS